MPGSENSIRSPRRVVREQRLSTPDIILNNNINYYTATDGSVGLTAIAERSVLIPLLVPNAMSIRGIFVAQSGYYGRNLYDCTYTPYDRRASLTMNIVIAVVFQDLLLS